MHLCIKQKIWQDKIQPTYVLIRKVQHDIVILMFYTTPFLQIKTRVKDFELFGKH